MASVLDEARSSNVHPVRHAAIQLRARRRLQAVCPQNGRLSCRMVNASLHTGLGAQRGRDLPSQLMTFPSCKAVAKSVGGLP